MKTLRHLALTVGRALALLAAITVALLPALPAEAHLHAPADVIEVAPGAHPHAAFAAMAASDTQDHRDHDGKPQHACDCCCLSHVPVVPSAATMQRPALVASALARAGDRDAPPDVIAERQPEPPRPLA